MDSQAEHRSLIELVFALPPPLLSLLVICRRPIHLLAQLSLAIGWSHPLGPWPSWILLFLWAAVCTLLPTMLAYGTPNLICLSILLYLTHQQQQKPPASTGSQVALSTHPLAVLHSLQDFQIIAEHYSQLTSPAYQFLTEPSNPQRSTHTIRACLTTLPISILISQFISTRSIAITVGSIVILWSSPWFKLLRSLLARSPLLQLISFLLTDLFLHLRFQPRARWNQLSPTNSQASKSIVAYIRTTFSSLLSLRKHPSTSVDSQGKSEIGPAIDPSQDIEFCLTIFENQRWWMGLDWTPNLLPHERPNWSDSLNHPVPSPTSLQLPAPTVFSDDSQKVLRKVEWSWIDPEWKIIDSAQVSGLKDEHHPLLQDPPAPRNHPSAPREKSPTASPTPPQTPELAQRRLRNRSASQAGSIGNNYLDSEIVTESLRSSGLGAGVVGGQSPKSATGWEVDANGWQYGDNHWEKMSKKSGIGRYTRRRAWTRKARLISSILPATAQSSPPSPSPPEERYPTPVLLEPRSASPASPCIGTISTIPVVPASSSTALSLNLKRSLGLLKRK